MMSDSDRDLSSNKPLEKPEMVFIDFDGVISKNAVWIVLKWIHRFINKYTEYPFEPFQNFFKQILCIPGEHMFPLLFSSLGLDDHLSMELYQGLLELVQFDDIKVAVEADFSSFIGFCKSASIPYKIFSSAEMKMKRLGDLKKIVSKENFYDLRGEAKSNPTTFLTLSETLGVDLKRCWYIDDAPMALRTGKLHGMTTAMMINDVFTFEDYRMFSSYIDFPTHSFSQFQEEISRRLMS